MGSALQSTSTWHVHGPRALSSRQDTCSQRAPVEQAHRPADRLVHRKARIERGIGILKDAMMPVSSADYRNEAVIAVIQSGAAIRVSKPNYFTL
jgi:hypothetical protein